jgi:hypothetical protein
MTPRERTLETLLFGKPDKVPFQPGGPRESTLKAWHAQGLPANANWFTSLCAEIGVQPDQPKIWGHPGVDFRMIPEFEQKVLERRAGSLIVQDWKGNICEISDQYDPSYLGGKGGKLDFVTRRWIKCPVENWSDWEEMKTRYNANDPSRFPSDFEDRCRKLRDRDSYLEVSFSGPFWQLREWMGFEGLCMAFIEQPDLVRAMAAFWEEHVSAILDKLFRHCTPDCIHIQEDMAYKEKAMISPAMCREFLMPAWRRWGDQAHAAGVAIYAVDSDGYVGELIPLWIESGFQMNDPLEVAAGNDLPAYRRQFGKRMAYSGGIDKRAMARGGEVIRAEMRRLDPVIKAGGYVPCCDHGVPPDVSWRNMVDFGRLLAKATGWLK